MVEKKTAKEEKGKGKSSAKKDVKKEDAAKEERILLTTGKRKRSVARATFKPGNGRVKINSVPIELLQSEMIRMRIYEPLVIAGDEWKRFNININVTGGGIMGQADAARQAIAKGLSELLGSDVKKRFLEYDRSLLVYDFRRTEPHKPPRSSQGPRRYKQRSKR
ncbi:MAG TPA: 30S ribosomal protein S9 [Candidatus Aenigmarchaeota archaeon]|nr:30S ribosomal protein S9 [Candidatus Aenigmarchaeota archaeon]